MGLSRTRGEFRGRVGRVAEAGCQLLCRGGIAGFCMGCAELFCEMKGEYFRCITCCLSVFFCFVVPFLFCLLGAFHLLYSGLFCSVRWCLLYFFGSRPPVVV